MYTVNSKTHGEWKLAADDQYQVPAALLPNNEPPEHTSSLDMMEQYLLLFSTMEQQFLHFSVCTLVTTSYAIPAFTRLQVLPNHLCSIKCKVKSWSCPCSWHTGIQVELYCLPSVLNVMDNVMPQPHYSWERTWEPT